MAPHASTRTAPGKEDSDGARLLWRLMVKRRWSQGDVRRRLKGEAGGLLPTGVISRLLWGDRRPSLSVALQMQREFKIPADAWLKPRVGTFEPPVAVDENEAA